MTRTITTTTTTPLSPVHGLVARIVTAVREGELAPGQRLVEAEFAKRFGVARSTVREAFQRLEAQGLLAVERYRGYLVRTLSREELRHVFEVRESLDGLAARLAAPVFRADHAELDQVSKALEQAWERSNLAAFTELNRQFHELVRRASGNGLIPRVLDALESSVYCYQYRLLVRSGAALESQEDHRRIHKALSKGDAAAAEEAMRAHVRRSLAELMTLPDSAFAGTR